MSSYSVVEQTYTNAVLVCRTWNIHKHLIEWGNNGGAKNYISGIIIILYYNPVWEKNIYTVKNWEKIAGPSWVIVIFEVDASHNLYFW